MRSSRKLIGCALLIGGVGGCSSPPAESQATETTATDGTDTDTDTGTDTDAIDFEPCPDENDVGAAARMRCTIEQLAELGEKRCGTPEGERAGLYVEQRLNDAGLVDVVREPFDFPAFVLGGSSLELVTPDGGVSTPNHDVFAYSGVGTVDAELVDIGTGHPDDYEGLDVTGKVVFVARDRLFHRSSQYKLAIEHGAAAMLYRSASPDNIIQIGTVADPEDGLGQIPALTIGEDDGRDLDGRLANGETIRVRAQVDASIEPGTGNNVIGWLPGQDPHYFVIGAHYDTWFTGSVDNGSGTTALIELAERLVMAGNRRYGIAFVAYDGEELGLFGGYTFLRKHVVVAQEPMLGFINLEMPANEGPQGLRAMAVTQGGPMVEQVDRPATEQVYPVIVDFETVTELFGGTIPTDIEGMYWSGLQGFTTVTDTPYYHTPQDTPDKVDTAFLAQSVDRLVSILDGLDDASPEDLTVVDPLVWRVETATTGGPDGMQLDVTVRDDVTQPVADRTVRAWVDVDDFTRVFSVSAQTDADGRTSLQIPQSALDAGAGGRWLHVLAVDEFPRGLAIVPLP